MSSFFRATVATALIAGTALTASACGGYSSPSSPSATPSPSPAPQVTIAIVGSSGSAAFTPNPANAAAGSSVAWRNNDSVLHHIVLDNGTDAGNVAPGATTRSITVSSGATAFHCTIHPSMVGTITN